MKYIIDCDGTLMNGKEANRDALSFIARLEDQHKDFIVMTNSIRSPEGISKRLSSVGIQLDINRIFNPIVAINTYIKAHEYKNAYIVGSDLEIEQVEVPWESNSPDIIILLDFEMENVAYNTLQKILDFMVKGIPVIAASKSTFYQREERRILDTGAFVHLLEKASGKSINILGKPSLAYFQAGINKLKAKPDEVTVIGDDWQTDIQGAKNMGCKSVLLRSGKYVLDDEKNCKPDMCVDNLMDILKD